MTIPAQLWEQVRQRANFACEYCGVTETDSAGELTVDHFHPQSRGGSDDPNNLLYCCNRCNQHKADYWPSQPTDPTLWNPRREAFAVHFLTLADGTLHAITPVGAFTLRRMRRNRPQLVEYHRRKHLLAEEVKLLTRFRDVIALLEQLREQQTVLLQEHRSLLEEQRSLLKLLLQSEEKRPHGE